MKKNIDTQLVSALNAERLIHSGCDGYIAFVIEKKQPKKLEEVLGSLRVPRYISEVDYGFTTYEGNQLYD